MNLSTTLNRKKQGEGGSALLFFYRLIPLISILTLILSCGIPSPVYLAPPERYGSTNVIFNHANRNNPDIFNGYEIFYLFYNSDSETIPSTDDEWETYFNNHLSSSIIANPNSSLMAYSYTATNLPGHGIRRAYASETDDHDDYIPVMIPVGPPATVVDLAGGPTARFQLIFKSPDGSSDLYLEEISSQTIISNFFESPYNYTKSSVILKRRVFLDEGATTKSLLSFDSPSSNSDADDLPAGTISYSIAFFALTTGFSMSSGQVISTVTYIGSME